MHFHKIKDSRHNLVTLNILSLPKINTKKFALYSSSFHVSHLWNQLPERMKTKH